jgi:hypothetical protein
MHLIFDRFIGKKVDLRRSGVEAFPTVSTRTGGSTSL